MALSVFSQNILLVDGKLLDASRPEVTAEVLHDVLRLGDQVIRAAIEDMYRQQKSRAPSANIQRGSIWLMHLAKKPEQVITQSGLKRDTTSQQNRGVFSYPEEVVDGFRPYLDVVQTHNLIPEVRSTEFKVADKVGVFLLARDVPLL